MISTTTLEQLRAWLAEPEGTRLEFKEAKAGYQFDKLLEYCVALANEGGGKILLGVSDQRPRRIVGSEAFAEPGRTESGLHERLRHRIPVEEVRTLEGRVVVVHVPSRLPGAAWQIGGRFLKRAGDALTALSGDELRAIFAETGPDFSAEVCPGASLADLAPAAYRSISHSLVSPHIRSNIVKVSCSGPRISGPRSTCAMTARVMASRPRIFSISRIPGIDDWLRRWRSVGSSSAPVRG